MAQKELIFIFPSMPSEICYADNVAIDLEEIALDIGGVDEQVINIDHPVNCATYGFNIPVEEFSDYEIDPLTIRLYTSDTDARLCMEVLGEEYRDAEGKYFQESCLLGMDTKEKDKNARQDNSYPHRIR
jgi:hypothetical protein